MARKKQKNPAAVQLAALRMVKMTPDERRQVAALGGKARAEKLSEDWPAEASAMGKKGGRSRADRLTPERRSEIARKAVEARWAKARTEPTQEKDRGAK